MNVTPIVDFEDTKNRVIARAATLAHGFPVSRTEDPFQRFLEVFGDQKIKAIKHVRTVTEFSLYDAKEWVEAVLEYNPNDQLRVEVDRLKDDLHYLTAAADVLDDIGGHGVLAGNVDHIAQKIARL